MDKRLKREFFLRDPRTVAKNLLGKIFCHQTPQGLISGMITEVEAYEAFNDPASHAYKGKSLRNQSLFLVAGHLYLYRIHRRICLDVTVGEVGIPLSVLIRSLEPLEGIDLMKKNRNQENILNLTTGPGKLTEAFGIKMNYNGDDICNPDSPIYILDRKVDDYEVTETVRVGISKAIELQNRFYITKSKFVSKR